MIDGTCAADGLRKCSECGSVLKGDCSKQACKNAGRTSLLPAGYTKNKKIRDVISSSDEDEDENADLTEDEIESEEDAPPIIYNFSEDDPSHKVPVKIGDYVQVIRGTFKGYYASVTAESYGDELEINYFHKTSTQGKFYVIKDNDFDSVERDDLIKVNAGIDTRGRFTFE